MQGHGHGGGGKQDKKAIPIPDIMEVETHYRDYLPLFSPPLTYLHGKGAGAAVQCSYHSFYTTKSNKVNCMPPVAVASQLLFKRLRCGPAAQIRVKIYAAACCMLWA
jgi:hypothetical protein